MTSCQFGHAPFVLLWSSWHDSSHLASMRNVYFLTLAFGPSGSSMHHQRLCPQQAWFRQAGSYTKGVMLHTSDQAFSHAYSLSAACPASSTCCAGAGGMAQNPWPYPCSLQYSIHSNKCHHCLLPAGNLLCMKDLTMVNPIRVCADV